jgi:hypothetical protein
LAHVTGIVVHDHWKPYYTLKGVLHALCNAHHLRELKALVEIEREDWARRVVSPVRVVVAPSRPIRRSLASTRPLVRQPAGRAGA